MNVREHFKRYASYLDDRSFEPDPDLIAYDDPDPITVVVEHPSREPQDRGAGTRTRIVTFKLDPQTLERLDNLAQRKRVHRSELIREAIRRLLESEGA